MKKQCLVGILLIAAITRTAHAEHTDTAGEPLLLLETAVSQAMQNNPVIAAAQEEARASKASIRPAAALEDPTVSFELSDYPVSTFNPHRSSGASNRVTVRQKIPLFGKRSALQGAAENESVASEAGIEVKARSVVAEVKQRYAELSLMHSTFGLLREQSALVQKTLEVAQNNFALSKAPQSDVLALQAEAANLTDTAIQLESKIESIRSSVNQLLGRNITDSWRPTPLRATDRSVVLLNEDDLYERALERYPMLKVSSALLEAAKQRERYADLNRLPDIEVMGGYNSRFSSSTDSGADEASIGIGITVPLWSGSKQDQLLEKARAERRRGENLEKDARIALRQQLHRALTSVKESEARIQLARSALLPLSEAAVASSSQGYAVGNVPLTAVLATLRSRFETQQKYQEALAQRAQSAAELEQLLGESDFFTDTGEPK